MSVRKLLAIGLAFTGALLIAASPAAAQAVCTGTRLPLKTPPLTSKPYVDMTLDGKTGPWLLDYGDTGTGVSDDVWQKPTTGTKLSLSGFNFPGLAAGARDFEVEKGSGQLATIGLHHGDVGTDILGEVTAEFRFDDANDPSVIVSTAACDPTKVPGNFLRIRQPDFFGPPSGSRGSKCPVEESKLPSTHRDYITPVCPNVPIVYIDIEQRPVDKATPTITNPKRGARTFAQIDTGYGDTYWPFTVDINEPYLAELKKLATLVKVGLVPVVGCGNEDSLREVYVAPGWKLNVVNETGRKLPGRYFDSFYFVVKPTKTTCGGIGRMTVPAAQLGVSFLRAFGTTIFMPSTSEVWIRTP